MKKASKMLFVVTTKAKSVFLHDMTRKMHTIVQNLISTQLNQRECDISFFLQHRKITICFP